MGRNVERHQRYCPCLLPRATAFLCAAALAACGGGGGGPNGLFPVTTVAGLAGQSGSANGVGADARFNHPTGIAVDGFGNLYVADSFNQTIRKITPQRSVSTFAGTSGQSGSRDDTGTSAQFNFPQGIVADASGILYVADTFNETIRKITTPGAGVIRFAGTPGRAGEVDLQGNPLFFTPRSVCADASGNVYVADTSNNTIRKITAQRSVVTFAGATGVAGSDNGSGTTARFNNPSGIAVDGSGNLYVADTFNHTIRKITPSAQVSTLAGTAGQSGSADGSGPAARFNYPAGIAVDGSGNVYVADTFNHTIRRITPEAAVSTIAGRAGIIGDTDDTGSNARFKFPVGMALDTSGNLFVADSLNFTIRKIATAPASGLDGGNPPSEVSYCQPIVLQSGTLVGGYNSDVYNWYDANCRLRTAALVRNDAPDPGGSQGGYLRLLSYEADGERRQCVGQPGTPWNGWGYAVNHTPNGLEYSSHDVRGSYRSLLNGTHHSIHEFKVRLSLGGLPVDVTIHWFFATGRSNPVYAITHDATPAGLNRVMADSRSPYGNLTFDGVTSGTSNVAGIGWGDLYPFTTTGSGPVTFNSPWDYRGTNTIPHVLMWSAAADAEMGSVQTQTLQAHVSGGEYGPGELANCWNRTSANPGNCPLHQGGTLILELFWPFELNQYQLPLGTTSKRMGWGMSYGAVGQSTYRFFDNVDVGYPYQSYSVFLVLGKRTDRPTAAQVGQIEVAARTTLSATVGTVVTTGPGGAGRTDAIIYNPAGYDPVYSVWVVAAASGGATFRLNPGTGSLLNPVFRIQGWTLAGAPSLVRLGGQEIAPGRDYFATVDSARQALWLTLMRTVSSAVELSVQP
jgi:ribosomal protein S11